MLSPLRRLDQAWKPLRSATTRCGRAAVSSSAGSMGPLMISASASASTTYCLSPRTLRLATRIQMARRVTTIRAAVVEEEEDEAAAVEAGVEVASVAVAAGAGGATRNQ